MKQWLLVFSIILLSACSTTYQRDSSLPNITLDSYAKDIIQERHKRINDNGYLEFEIIFYSNSAKDIVYKVDWLDKDGFVLRDVLSEDYQALRIPAKQKVVLRKRAADVRAQDFRIEIRKQ